ncbi:flagellar assembly protein FliW [Pedococcus sp. KACC 23699]|uniref:Flagellar assembly protein FliW n=1 Tax=Pedococcus sp. KACC 23699 TaxID=3149228 RepID=A0AAU7JYR6_9MICO
MTTAPTPSATALATICVGGGLVGFPESELYTVVGGDGGVFELAPPDNSGPTFVAAVAGLFFPDYRPVIDDATAQRLDLSDADDALVLAIVTVGSDISAAYGNLFAPVVVNTRTGAAEQVVLSGQDFPLRAPLVAAAAGR